MMEALSYPPILWGLVVLLFAGIAFPITGVYLLRMNLLPLRFMLMHGAVLGGAIALAFHINSFWTTMAINLLLVWFMTNASRKLKTNAGFMSIFMMSAAMGLAFIFIYKFNVPAKDTMGILWGNLFLLGQMEVIGALVLCLSILVFQILFSQPLKAVFFNAEVAHSAGVNEKSIYYMVILITAFTVAIAMKLIGALMLESLLILPVIIASFHVNSHRALILWSGIWGLLFSAGGFVLSIWMKIPISSAIAAIAVLFFLFFYFRRSNK